MTPEERYESAKRHYLAARRELNEAERKYERAEAVFEEAARELRGAGADSGPCFSVPAGRTMVGMFMQGNTLVGCKWCGGTSGWEIVAGKRVHMACGGEQ